MDPHLRTNPRSPGQKLKNQIYAWVYAFWWSFLFLLQEKDEVMKNMTSAHRQNEAERERQMEAIRERRERRRAEKKTTEEKALELLEKAVQMDKM